MPTYIYEYESWPEFTWEQSLIAKRLAEIRFQQGSLIGKMGVLGFALKEEANLYNLTQDVLQSSAIEGEFLNREEIRSSIAKKLGLDSPSKTTISKSVEGIVEITLDATRNTTIPLTKNRICGWHNSLFPNGFSGMLKIQTGQYRTGRMQVVSGAYGKEKIHFEAVPPNRVNKEMSHFLKWINTNKAVDPILMAAIAHFRFIIIHPFDDGNGRIARAISDHLLAISDNQKDRFYSLSHQLLLDKKKYYAILQKTQHQQSDITAWILWFLNCLEKAFLHSEEIIKKSLRNHLFWEHHETTPLNERQRKMIICMQNGIEGKMQSSKWAKMAKCSQDTALRDIQDLISKKIIVQENTSGRNTSYILNY